MDLRMSWKTLATLLVGFTLAATTQTTSASTSLSTFGLQNERPVSTGNGFTMDQQLVRCIEVAKQGNVKQAFEMAKQAKQMFRTQRMFDVSYINTLMTIVDETESKCDVKILNEVITVVNDAKRTKVYDGTGDPEVAFHFMKSLGRLGTITDLFSASVSSKIKIYEGQIAINLKSNPNYPKNALEALAAPMVDMARGYAHRKDQDKTFAALNSAVSVGFGEFKDLEKEEWLQAVADEGAMADLNKELGQSYKVAVEAWSRTVVSQFRPMTINYDVASTSGGRIRNSDFGGKVVVVDLWATWCPPCLKGIPHYMELQKKYGEKGVAVVGISMDKPNDINSAMQAVKTFAEKQKFNYLIGIGDPAIESQLVEKMVLPTTIFFGRNGQVRYIARGYHDYAKVEAITKVLMNENQTVGASVDGSVQNF